MKKFDKDKYLRKLRFKKYKRYLYIGLPCFLVLLIGIYFAYSKFSVYKDSEVVKTTVGEFLYGDIIINSYIDGVYSSTFPEKRVGINVEKVTCDNDVTGKWDEDTWQLRVANLKKRTKCNVYFVTPSSCDINDNVKCIGSRDELATLATEVNNGDNKPGKIYYLTSDIDLGGKFDSSGNALSGNTSWTPIGTEDNPFSGIFNGNGHIISNMYVDRSNYDYNGLFGSAKNGVIENLGVISSFVKGKEFNAGIVGKIGTVKNSFNLATVKSNGRTGGICGISCYVINSYNGGNIISGDIDLVGGISGGYETIRNCYNYGTINANHYSIGGILGWDGNVYNSYNLGTVNGGLEIGTSGVLGQAVDGNVISNSYNSGNISKGGGILGVIYDLKSIDNITINNNYYLKGTANYGLWYYNSDYHAESLEANEMPSVISVINENNAFVSDTNNINNGYPILKWQNERENN